MSEMPECFVVRTPKARKQHKCCECRGRIQLGETYERASGIWDGEPMRFKTCCDCAALRAEVNEEADPWDLCPFEALGEWCQETREASFWARFKAIKEKRKIVLTPAPPGAIVGT